MLLFAFFKHITLPSSFLSYSFTDKLTSDRKLELMPRAEKLIECLTNFNKNKCFGVSLRAAEEAARRAVSNQESDRMGS